MKTFILIFILIILTTQNIYSKDLNASLAYLPLLAESSEKGYFVDLVKAIDEVYTEGEIHIRIYPFARSIFNIENNLADFHIPTIKNPNIEQTNLPYKIVSEKMGTVSFVLYSNIKKPFTRDMLEEAIKKYQNGKPFPYSILAGRGIESQTPFKVIPINDLERALRRIALGRADALIWAQEESDFIIKKNKLKKVHREFWQDFDDSIIIPKNIYSSETDKILSNALIKLRESGKLNEIYLKIHRPYDDWQPADMNW